MKATQNDIQLAKRRLARRRERIATAVMSALMVHQDVDKATPKEIQVKARLSVIAANALMKFLYENPHEGLAGTGQLPG